MNPVDPVGGGVYAGVVSDCFCPTADCLIDAGADGTSDCVDHNGDTCEPADADLDGYADNCDGTSSVTIDSVAYAGVEVGCYCPSTECDFDNNNDNSTDCYTPDGLSCSLPLDGDNTYQDCATSATVKANQSNGLAVLLFL